MKTTIYYILAAALLVACSWLGTCLMVKLITMCFELEFTLRIGTGVWLSLFLLGTVLNVKPDKK